MEEEKKLVGVSLEDIGKKIGNRIDFYRFLRERCKPYDPGNIYLPKFGHCSVGFLKDIATKKKRVSGTE